MAKTVEATGKEPLQKARYHHGDLRAGLIEATRRLVEEKGPDGFSVSDACRLAGVSTAAPYKHFKNKDEMLVAMVLEGMVRHRENMFAALEGIPPGSPQRVQALGKEYVTFALREPGVFRLKFGGFTDGLNDERLKAAGEQTFGIVLQEVALCLGEDDITQEVRKRGFMLWSFVHGLSFILYDKDMTEMGGGVDLDGLLADIAERVLSD
ncbi:TetR/AcrR family transcriptional regulator [Yoonia sp. SDW83-1]|uniref:TetR/AcrR family transcriptional regulator n=1 Tax=Yoonia sp. SDW83-1 TaxID=3366945 RepID=UPI00398C41C9